jgi:hypothetical protein
MDTISVEALSPAAFVAALDALPHETRAVVVATERERPWAYVVVSPMTDTCRSLFPAMPGGVTGDTRRRSAQGVMTRTADVAGNRRPLGLVVERARRMANEAQS